MMHNIKLFCLISLVFPCLVFSWACAVKPVQHEQVDSREAKYAPYMIRFKERVESAWKYPPEAAKRGIQGVTLIKFTITKNGQPIDIQIVETSGYNDLDEAVIQALKDAEPYPPLPDDWGKDQLPITGRFVYSIGDTSSKSSDGNIEMLSSPH